MELLNSPRKGTRGITFVQKKGEFTFGKRCKSQCEKNFQGGGKNKIRILKKGAQEKLG